MTSSLLTAILITVLANLCWFIVGCALMQGRWHAHMARCWDKLGDITLETNQAPTPTQVVEVFGTDQPTVPLMTPIGRKK